MKELSVVMAIEEIQQAVTLFKHDINVRYSSLFNDVWRSSATPTRSPDQNAPTQVISQAEEVHLWKPRNEISGIRTHRAPHLSWTGDILPLIRSKLRHDRFTATPTVTEGPTLQIETTAGVGV